MSGETSITIIGNLTNDPELRFTTTGSAAANFTIASTPRTFDAQAKEWKDGETLFLRATVWRDAAEHAAASLTKGSRVVASGVLKPRTYETKAGEKRTVIELEIDEIGLSLKYTAATPTRLEANRSQDTVREGDEDGDRGEDTYRPVGAGVPNPYFADDDPWFGKDANPSGRVTIPGAPSEPSF